MRRVLEASYAGGYRVQVRFDDGAVKVVDMEPYLTGEMFEPLRDPVRFRTVRLEAEYDTIVWDNGADVAPEFLYEIGRDVKGAAA